MKTEAYDNFRMDTVIETLSAVVPPAQIRTWDALDPFQQAVLSKALIDRSIYWVDPTTEAELAAIVAVAHQQGWRILPCGHASKLDWGGLIQGVTLVVSTARLNRLIDHAVGDLTVTAEAGMPFAQLQQTLNQAGQFLAIDPSFPDRATLGGVIATGDTGSLRHRYNSVRDMLLGISFVRHDGESVKAGGRVVKNVAGYDLMKLFTGSFGTLGMITQATFRVYPLPQASQSVVIRGDAPEIAQATQTILGSALMPTCLDLLSRQFSQALELGDSISVIVRFQSIVESVHQQLDRTVELAQALNLSATVYSDDADLWQRAAELISPPDQADTIVCKIGVKPSEAVSTIQSLESTLPTPEILIHAGSGIGRMRVRECRSTQLQAARSTLLNAGGYLSILQAPATLKQQLEVWGYSGSALDLMKRIKTQFDPQTLFSPHRFVGGI